MYLYVIRYQIKRGQVDHFVTLLEWHTPIQKDDVLFLVYKAMVLPEKDHLVVPKEIREQTAWKVDSIVHFPSCSLKGGSTTLIVSPTKDPAAV